ncbi:hypothetical protein ABVT39_001804 [Epinephelus coioides]
MLPPLKRASQAETLTNCVQPKLHPTTSTGTDVSSVQVDGKNAAAGKMAPNTAPLKGEDLTFVTVNVCRLKLSLVVGRSRWLRLRSVRPFAV